MFYKIFIFSTLFIFCSLTTFSAVFTVTSNADSGPGTLREALTLAAANGSATQDVINFNITDVSEAGRTITLTTVLPDISGNLIIDASTQPGNYWGVSNAKIKLFGSFYNNSIPGNCLLYINKAQNVEIYALFLDYDPIYFKLHNSVSYAIYGSSCKNIIIGAPGKGNIIENYENNLFFDSGFGNQYGTDPSYLSENVKISSNLIGIDPDGKTACALGNSTVWSNNVKNITFGGTTRPEGNVFAGIITLFKNTDNVHLPMGDYLISNNIGGLDNLGQNVLLNTNANTGNGVNVNDSYGSMNSCEISNNVILGGPQTNLTCFLTVKGNKFGTDITGTNVFQHSSFGMVLGYSSGGAKIGGSSIADQNIFAGCLNNLSFDKNQFGVIYNISSTNVEIVGNVFKCNNGFQAYYANINLPSYATITNRSVNSVEGTATPNSRVDMYYSKECNYCEPQELFASVIADASGKWQYSNNLFNYAVIVSSTISGTTSGFSNIGFTNQTSDVVVTMACNGPNGSIKGLKLKNALNINWYDDSGKVISNSVDLLNALPGKYHLVLDNGYCSVSSPVYEIKDAANQIDDANKIVKKASCTVTDGNITGLKASISGSQFIWKDGSGKVRGNSIDLLNVEAGNYTLTVTNTNLSCSQVYGPVTVPSATGPQIDQNAIQITPSNCGTSTGSITNITPTGTGTLTYTWKNEQQQTVATTLDLKNQPAGKYTLQVTDQSSCGSVSSSQITIPELNGITLDETQVINTSTTCSNSNGSLTNIKITGATTYQWFDSNNNLVATNNNLTNVLAGTYHLIASNATCSKQSANYIIADIPGSINYSSTKTLVNATCGLNNGSIQVMFTGSTSPKAVRWVNSQTQTVGNTTLINNIDAGTYQLYVTDDNNCESYHSSYTITRVPVLQYSPSSATVINDNCTLKKGVITGALPTGGMPPYKYAWFDSNNNAVATTADIKDLGAGNYTLNITDGIGCSTITHIYTVQDLANVISPPSVSNLQLCAPGEAIAIINNPTSNYKYRLYNSTDAITPIIEQTDPHFKIKINKNSEFYVSQISGSCESSRVQLKVTVGLTAVNIANTFTPNGDGRNDTWKIEGIESYPNAKVEVYNRNGQIVYSSIGYGRPFDGRWRGNSLPAGIYYYMINLNTKCDLIAGTLTMMR